MEIRVYTSYWIFGLESSIMAQREIKREYDDDCILLENPRTSRNDPDEVALHKKIRIAKMYRELSLIEKDICIIEKHLVISEIAMFLEVTEFEDIVMESSGKTARDLLSDRKAKRAITITDKYFNPTDTYSHRIKRPKM
jgi:hypothetical protein